jgi:hypothetical protein
MDSRSSPTITFALSGSLARSDLPGLRARVCALLEGSGAESALCEVGELEADAVAVEALASLRLAAARHGLRLRLRGASPELVELVGFMGLRELLAE